MKICVIDKKKNDPTGKVRNDVCIQKYRSALMLLGRIRQITCGEDPEMMTNAEAMLYIHRLILAWNRNIQS